MDPIDLFIRGNKKISLPVLLHAHSNLSLLQLNKGAFSLDEVLQCLSMRGLEMSTADLNAHAALIYEGILSPVAVAGNHMMLQMNRDVIGNESNFLKSLLNALYSRCGGMEYTTVEQFNMEAFMYLKHFNAPKPSTFVMQPPAAFNGRRPIPTSQSFSNFPPRSMQPSLMHQPTRQLSSFPQQQFTSQQQQPRMPLPTQDHSQKRLSHMFSSEMIDESRIMGRIEFEKSEPIVRLLAQVRKVGMDILFPQCAHDKVKIFFH
jgi:hypothetical protein